MDEIITSYRKHLKEEWEQTILNLKLLHISLQWSLKAFSQNAKCLLLSVTHLKPTHVYFGERIKFFDIIFLPYRAIPYSLNMKKGRASCTDQIFLLYWGNSWGRRCNWFPPVFRANCSPSLSNPSCIWQYKLRLDSYLMHTESPKMT